MDSVDFVHQQRKETRPGIEPASLGIQDQHVYHYKTQALLGKVQELRLFTHILWQRLALFSRNIF